MSNKITKIKEKIVTATVDAHQNFASEMKGRNETDSNLREAAVSAFSSEFKVKQEQEAVAQAGRDAADTKRTADRAEKKNDLIVAMDQKDGVESLAEVTRDVAAYEKQYGISLEGLENFRTENLSQYNTLRGDYAGFLSAFSGS